MERSPSTSPWRTAARPRRRSQYERREEQQQQREQQEQERRQQQQQQSHMRQQQQQQPQPRQQQQPPQEREQPQYLPPWREQQQQRAAPKQTKKIPHLQSLLTYRPPPPHPTDEQLSRVPPGDSFRVDDIYYHRNTDGELVVLQRSRHQMDHNDPNKHIHAYSVIYPRKDLKDNRELLVPKPDIPDNILRHDRIFFPSTVGDENKEHYQNGTFCHCAPTTPDIHQVNLVQPVCFPKQIFKREDSLVDFNFSYEKMYANSSRSYYFSRRSDRPVLEIPSPFLLAWRWTPKPFLAVNSQEPLRHRQELFYALQGNSYQSMYQAYMTEPSEWTPELHPHFEEPSQVDELHLWSRDLYGAETLPRILPVYHPLRPAKIAVYCAMQCDFKVPVISSEDDITKLDRFIKDRLDPFISRGHGKIVCPVCILNISAGRYYAAAYGRTEFLEHFKKRHFSQLHTIGLAFTTGYNTRLYQALVLYHYLMWTYTGVDSDDPSLPPFANVDHSIYKLEMDDRIRKLLVDHKQEDTISNASEKTPPSFGWAQETKAEDDSAMEEYITEQLREQERAQPPPLDYQPEYLRTQEQELKNLMEDD